MIELCNDIEGVRVFSQAGGCSGLSFGMTFSETVKDSDLVSEVKLIVGAGTIDLLCGVQIDYVDDDNGQASFVLIMFLLLSVWADAVPVAMVVDKSYRRQIIFFE